LGYRQSCEFISRIVNMFAVAAGDLSGHYGVGVLLGKLPRGHPRLLESERTIDPQHNRKREFGREQPSNPGSDLRRTQIIKSTAPPEYPQASAIYESRLCGPIHFATGNRTRSVCLPQLAIHWQLSRPISHRAILNRPPIWLATKKAADDIRMPSYRQFFLGEKVSPPEARGLWVASIQTHPF